VGGETQIATDSLAVPGAGSCWLAYVRCCIKSAAVHNGVAPLTRTVAARDRGSAASRGGLVGAHATTLARVKGVWKIVCRYGDIAQLAATIFSVELPMLI